MDIHFLKIDGWLNDRKTQKDGWMDRKLMAGWI